MSCDKNEKLTLQEPSSAKRYFISPDEYQLFGEVAAEWNWRLNVDGIHFYNACKHFAKSSPEDGPNHIFSLGNNGPSHDEFGIDVGMQLFTDEEVKQQMFSEYLSMTIKGDSSLRGNDALYEISFSLERKFYKSSPSNFSNDSLAWSSSKNYRVYLKTYKEESCHVYSYNDKQLIVYGNVYDSSIKTETALTYEEIIKLLNDNYLFLREKANMKKM